MIYIVGLLGAVGSTQDWETPYVAIIAVLVAVIVALMTVIAVLVFILRYKVIIECPH